MSFVRAWWRSFPSGRDRVAMVILLLICLTVVFSTALVQTLVVLFTLLVLFRFVFDRSFTFRRTPLDLPFLAFIAGRVISVFFSRDIPTSLPALYIEFFFYFVFFLVTQSLRRDEMTAAYLLGASLVGAGAIAGLIGTFKVLFSIELRASSTTAGVYTLGGYLCAVLPLALYLASNGGNGAIRWWRWLPPLAICSGIVMTFDRLHWLAMAAVIVVSAMISSRRKLVLVFGAALTFFMFVPSVRVRIDRMVEYGDFTGGREVLWAGASRLITDHPVVGFGPKTFAGIFPLFEKMPVQGVGSWHNDYLQVYMDSGLIALIPLLWLLGATYYHGRKAILSVPAPECGLVQSILVSISVVFLFGGILDTHVGIVFRVLLALLALLMRRQSMTVVERTPRIPFISVDEAVHRESGSRG